MHVGVGLWPLGKGKPFDGKSNSRGEELDYGKVVNYRIERIDYSKEEVEGGRGEEGGRRFYGLRVAQEWRTAIENNTKA